MEVIMHKAKAVFSIISKTERDMAHSSYSLKTTLTPIAKNARIYLRFIMLWIICYIVWYCFLFCLCCFLRFYESITIQKQVYHVSNQSSVWIIPLENMTF
jgi:hypothetical protein